MPEPKNCIRCIGCNKIIAEGSMQKGEIKIICSKCGTINTIKAEQKEKVEYSGVIKIIDDVE